MTDHKPRGEGPLQVAKDAAWTIFLVVGPILGFFLLFATVLAGGFIWACSTGPCL